MTFALLAVVLAIAANVAPGRADQIGQSPPSSSVATCGSDLPRLTPMFRLERLVQLREAVSSSNPESGRRLVAAEIAGRTWLFALGERRPLVVPGALYANFDQPKLSTRSLAVVLQDRTPAAGVVEAMSPERRGSNISAVAPLRSLEIVPGRNIGVITAEPVEVGEAIELPGEIMAVVVPTDASLRIGAMCFGDLVIAPSVGGAVVLARGRPVVETSSREVVVRGERTTVLVSACCTGTEIAGRPASVGEVLLPAYLRAVIARDRLRELDAPLDRLEDVIEAAGLLMNGNFDEAAQILRHLTNSPYGRLEVVRYMDALAALGAIAFGRPDDRTRERSAGVEGLPVGRQIDLCTSSGVAGPRPTADRAMRIPASALRGLSPRLREALQRCEVSALRATGDHRGALDSLRRNFADPVRVDDAWVLLENIALLLASGERSLALLYRDRLEANWRRSFPPTDLRSFQAMPQLGEMLSPAFVVDVVTRLGQRLGDAALTARLFKLALERASPKELRVALLNLDHALVAITDPRLQAYVVANLATRLVAAKADLLTEPAFPVYFSLGRMLSPSGPWTAAPAARLLAAAYAIELGLAEDAAESLDAIVGALAPEEVAWLDEVMRKLARILAETVPIGDVVGRLDRRWANAQGVAAARWPALRHELQIGAVRDAAGLSGAPTPTEGRASARESALLARIRAAGFEIGR